MKSQLGMRCAQLDITHISVFKLVGVDSYELSYYLGTNKEFIFQSENGISAIIAPNVFQTIVDLTLFEDT